MVYAMLLTPLLALVAGPGHADQSATMDSGQTVVLKDDGTSEHAEDGADTAAERTAGAFWTHVTKNVAKILVVLVALLALRWVIQRIGNAVKKRGSS